MDMPALCHYAVWALHEHRQLGLTMFHYSKLQDSGELS